MTADIYSCYAGEVTSMNKITSSEFQSNYQRLDEPVIVMARSRTLGTWYPKGTEPFEDSPELGFLGKQLDNANAEIARLKRELAARLTIVAGGEGSGLKTPSARAMLAGLAAEPVETFAPTTAVRATVRNGGFGHSTPAPKGT
jgi:hypothetical protein